MAQFITWIKQNKITAFLLVVIAFFLARQSSPVTISQFASKRALSPASVSMNSEMAVGMMAESASGILPPRPEPDVPPTDSSDRLVITDTNLSLLVDDVTASIRQVQQTAESLGGFLVNSNLSKPEGAASGSITIRVPSDSLDHALGAFRDLSVRVVSENVQGRDVTDQYEDIDARLAVLNKTKTRFEAILDQAVEIQDLLQVQRELVNLQSQIDNLIGRQQFLKQSANLSKVTIFLSTDELALPYTPDEVWRPSVIFKTAVRSLISSFRSIANSLIWLTVYSVIWIPALIVIWLLNRFARRRNQPTVS